MTGSHLTPAVDKSTKSRTSLWLLPHSQVGMGGSPTWQLISLIFFLPPLCSATDLFSPGRERLEWHCAWGVGGGREERSVTVVVPTQALGPQSPG